MSGRDLPEGQPSASRSAWEGSWKLAEGMPGSIPMATREDHACDSRVPFPHPIRA